MNFSFRTARNLGLFILLVIIIIESLFAYISMSKSAERLTAIITVDQVKLRHWYDVAEIITHAKDKLYDYRLGQTDVVASKRISGRIFCQGNGKSGCPGGR
jgi:hypothetical protein